METTEILNFWDYFSRGSDIISYISVVLSGITLLTTVGIRRSLLSHIEKSDYLNDIDSRIKTLRSFEETLKKDPELCTDNLLALISDQLEDILISYETILKKKIISQIKKLQNLTENCKGYKNTDETKRECQKQLHAICTRLEKEKKVL